MFGLEKKKKVHFAANLLNQYIFIATRLGGKNFSEKVLLRLPWSQFPSFAT